MRGLVALCLLIGGLMGAVVERVGAEVHVNIDFNAPPVVKAFVEDPTFVTGFFGPFGCSKTTAGVMKTYGYGQMYPGARILVTRATWPALRDTTAKTFFEWLPEGVAGTYERTPKTFWMPTPEGKPIEVIFRSMDDQADIANVLSLDLAAAWFDEPQGGVSVREDGTLEHQPGIKHDLFLAVLGRLGRQKGYPGMAWLTGNPPSPSHWIAKEFDYDPGQSGADAPKNTKEDYRLYLGTQDTNRANLPPQYYERLSRLYGVDTPMAQRFVRGEWIDFATEKPFKAKDIQTYEACPEGLIVEGAVDPAISKKDTAATTALVVGGQVRRGGLKGTIFELHHDEGHWSVYQTVAEILKATRQWKVRTWRIEDVAYQKALAETLDHEARLAGVPINVELVTPDADKIRRANAWAPMVEDGTIRFRDRGSKLVKAMLAVPQDKRAWDLTDAAGLCFRGFPRLQPESQRIPGMEISTPKTATSYAVKPVPEAKAPVSRRPFAPVRQAQGMARASNYAVKRAK